MSSDLALLGNIPEILRIEQDILNLTTENDTRIKNEKSYIQTIEQHTQTIEQLKNEINELRNRPSVEEISGEKDRRIKELERDI